MFASKKDLAVELKLLLVTAERRPGGPGRLKRAALARKMRVSPSSLYAYLDGTTLPPADVLDRLLDVLDVDGVRRRQLAVARDVLDPHGGPTSAAGPHPGLFQLPPDISGFTGRAVEVARLDELLPNGDGTAVAISTVDGTAGVGKTALAVHWAHSVRDRFAGGQLYVNLRGYALDPPLAPLEALARLLHACGVPAGRVPTDVEAAASIYRSVLADKRMLLLLDNAASAEQVRPLLPGNGGSVVVVTSRDRLGGLVARDGAHRLHLDVLSPPDAHAMLTGILGAGLGPVEGGAVAELAVLCARLPLALRIAAANLITHPHLRVTDYVARLRTEDRLKSLTVAGDPHSAVSVSLDLSYQRLPVAARRMFRLIGPVPGPDVTVEAAAALADLGADEAARLLEVLARAHLLNERVAGRYACHELLRRYAVDIAAREETTSATPRMPG
jgi:transcriptional regulator with XRE-family HTH domain